MVNTVFVAILAFLGIYFLYVSIKGIIVSIRETAILRDLSKDIKGWPKVVAKIERLGFGLDYEYPGLVKNVDDIDGDLAKEAAKIEFEKRKAAAIDNKYLYGDVLISYSYEKDGQKYITRSIGILKGARDLDMLYKLKPGSKIKAFVNPDDPSEAYMRRANEEELSEIANEMIFSNINYLAIGMGLLALSYLSTTVDFVF